MCLLYIHIVIILQFIPIYYNQVLTMPKTSDNNSKSSSKPKNTKETKETKKSNKSKKTTKITSKSRSKSRSKSPKTPKIPNSASKSKKSELKAQNRELGKRFANIFKSEPEKLPEFLAELKSSNNAKFQSYLLRCLNYFLDKNDLKTTKQLINIAEIDFATVTDISLGVLVIRYLTISNNLEDAIKLYKSLLTTGATRKRHLYFIIDKYLQLNTKKALEDAIVLYDEYMTKHYEIAPEDIYPFINHKHVTIEQIRHVLTPVVNKPLIFDNKQINTTTIANIDVRNTIQEFDAPVLPRNPGEPDTTTPKSLQLIKFTTAELTELSNIFRDLYKQRKQEHEYTKYMKFLSNKPEYDYVVDGANILFYGERTITENSYNRLNSVIHTLLRSTTSTSGKKPSIQLVLHERHFKLQKYRGKRGWRDSSFVKVANILKKLVLLPTVTVYKTPVRMNDDWYQIISAIRGKKTILVTNDQFRDHIFKISPLLRIWRKERIAEYHIARNNTEVKIHKPLNYSTRVQLLEHNYAIPMTNSKWIKI